MKGWPRVGLARVPLEKEKVMKKFLFTLLVLGMSSIAIVGCKAEGEIDDPDMNASVPALR
jgi:hypothetical protein